MKNTLPQDESITLSATGAVTFKTIGFDRAARLGLINQDDSPQSRCKARYARITEWYTKEEGAILRRAVDQLGGRNTLLVNRDGEIAIFRASSEIEDVAEELAA